MYDPIVVEKGRTTIIQISLGVDVSTDDITSEIRAEAKETSPVIATWVVTFLSDGIDGELVLTLDDASPSEITVVNGLMDLKRVTGGKSVKVFDEPLPVVFKDVVTQ